MGWFKFLTPDKNLLGRKNDVFHVNCMKRLFLLLIALNTAPLRSAAEMDLRQSMPREIFTASGLDKLSPAELAVLSNWFGTILKTKETSLPASELEKEIAARVEERLQEEKAKLAEEKKETSLAFFGWQEKKGEDLERISSRIVGDFFGWSGNTVFVLENGQIWQQRQAGSYYKRLENPEVIIEKRLIGYWMVVPALKASCPVKRIR